MANNYLTSLLLRKTLHRTSQSAAVLFVLLLCNASPAWATTCANAIVINPASLPIVGQAVTCGTTDDLNSTTVPGAICGTGDLDFYKDGTEALYSSTTRRPPPSSGTRITMPRPSLVTSSGPSPVRGFMAAIGALSS